MTAKLEPAPTTAKLEPAPANAPAPARPATQMSASAVPSTLDSPQDPSVAPRAATEGDAVVALGAPGTFNAASDEIHGAAVVRGEAARDDAVNAPPFGDATVPDPGRRVGPATMMSPAVIAPLPGESTPPLAPEQAVVDVGAPAHAFVPYGGGSSPAFGGPQGMMHHGGAGPGGAPRRSMSTTFLVLVVGGVVAAVALLVVAAIAVVFVTRRRAAEADDPFGSRQPSGAVAPGAPDSPRLPPRMSGTRARVTVTSSGALDPQAVRAVVDAALPRLDVCFAATELDPPNHEAANYDLEVAPSGEVRRAEPTPPLPGRSAKLDACIVQSLRSVRMPRSAKSSAVKLTFVAPIEPR